MDVCSSSHKSRGLTFRELVSIWRQSGVCGGQGAGVRGVVGALGLVEDQQPVHPRHICNNTPVEVMSCLHIISYHHIYLIGKE